VKAFWRVTDPESDVDVVLVGLASRPDAVEGDVAALRSVGTDGSIYLQVEAPLQVASSPAAWPPSPLYYILVVARNGAGLEARRSSLPVMVVAQGAPLPVGYRGSVRLPHGPSGGFLSSWCLQM
jgi:hypothetical protein